MLDDFTPLTGCVLDRGIEHARHSGAVSSLALSR